MAHHGKIAIVTGGGRGLGRAIALGLSRAGFRVAITAAWKRDEIGAVAKEAPEGQIYPVMADVSRESACAALVNEVEARLGAADRADFSEQGGRGGKSVGGKGRRRALGFSTRTKLAVPWPVEAPIHPRIIKGT